MKTMRLLNKDGDRVLVWDKKDDESMLEFVKKKMSQGYTFFIVDKNIEPGTEIWKPLSKSEDAKSTRRLSMHDPDAKDLVESGKAGVARGSAKEIKTVGVARKAEDVVKNDTVAVAARTGG